MIGQGKATEVSHIVQVCYFSVSLTYQESTPCISTPFSGLLIFSRWQLKMHCPPSNSIKDSRISITTSLILCMKMFADPFSKSINFCFRSCWLLKFSSVKINLILLSGGTCSLALQAKSKSSPIPQIGSQTVHGLIFTANSMV